MHREETMKMPIDIAREIERGEEGGRIQAPGTEAPPSPSSMGFLPETAGSEAFYDEWKETLAAIAEARTWGTTWLEGEELSAFVDDARFHTTLERHTAQFFLFALFGILAGYLSLILLWNHSSLPAFLLQGVVGG
ncbi:MAG: hypothetical protein D6812_14710 [Deltaproteobacteria bacterium]|nr:MAG: hypothetical protein D6812_14710 [Deltaproteobacteria bacterium]